MAYFLKISKQQSRTYLAIYESFYSPDVKGTKHRCYRNLGNLQKLIDSGIEDPIAYFQKEVDRLNAKRKTTTHQKVISEVSPVQYLGYFPLAHLLDKLDLKAALDKLQAPYALDFNVFEIFSRLIYASLVPMDRIDKAAKALAFLGEVYPTIIDLLTDKYHMDTTHIYTYDDDLSIDGHHRLKWYFDASMFPINLEVTSLDLNDSNLIESFSALSNSQTPNKDRVYIPFLRKLDEKDIHQEVMMISDELEKTENLARYGHTLNNEVIALAGYRLKDGSKMDKKNEERLYEMMDVFNELKQRWDDHQSKGSILVAYTTLLLLRLLQSQVLQDKYTLPEIIELIQSFKVVRISAGTYLNLTTASPLISDLATEWHLPLTLYHLTDHQIRQILTDPDLAGH